jgi:FtsP/CotA-like multicopper oxidase with cupredoxin domain
MKDTIRRCALALATYGITQTGAAFAGGFNIPTDAPPSPLFGAQPFTQEMLLFEEFGTKPMPSQTCDSCTTMPQPVDCASGPKSDDLDAFLAQPLWPAAMEYANTSLHNPWEGAIGGCLHRTLATSAIEGRPSGEWFAHQRWSEYPAVFYFQSAQTGARDNGGLRDGMQLHHWMYGEFGPSGLYYHGGTNKDTKVQFHPLMPPQNANSVWTFDGTMPPKLLMARYGMPIIFRHYNALPIDVAANKGFGMHTISTHEHNGHNAAESDGYTAAFFFPGQFYDYHWPMQLAGRDSINTDAADPWAGAPNGSGGTIPLKGDWHETMSTHWFHDHMLDFTAQNVYKGNAAMMNYYSVIDRGKEDLNCNYDNPANPNMCLPSGTALDWGNRDYDVNLLVADKAWDAKGQLFFNVFNKDGFLGDRVLVNWAYKPYFNVRARRYRFRILNGAVSRYFKIAIVTEAGQRVPFHMVANDGNLLEHAVPFPNAQSRDLPSQGIAERYDIVVDFARYAPGTKLYMVNLLEHQDGKGPKGEVPLADVLSGKYKGDPAVGKFLEFRVVAMKPGAVDQSMNPADYEVGKKTMVPPPTFTAAELANARQRTFVFGRANGTDAKPWTIATDGGQGFTMDAHRISAEPTKGAVEIWHIVNGGSGWSHPVHIHFEEGKILARGGKAPPLWEQGSRKDVYRIGGMADTTNQVDLAIRFREFMGSYMEHCHNTQHEDNAMLLRWDIKNPGATIAIPTPVQKWEGTFYEPSFAIGATR